MNMENIFDTQDHYLLLLNSCATGQGGAQGGQQSTDRRFFHCLMCFFASSGVHRIRPHQSQQKYSLDVKIFTPTFAL